MKKILFCLLMLPFATCLVQKQNSNPNNHEYDLNTPQGPENADEFEIFIDSLITTQLKKESIPGAAFVFVKDGKIFFMKGYGLANIERNIAVDPKKTIYRIGSISKVFTADALLQLADKNKINLSQDVNNYLHNLKIPSTFSTPINTRHILTHTTGLDEIRPGTQSPDSAGVLPLSQFLANRLVRLWSPGEIVMYSTYGITLGGLLVENISNQKFEAYLRDNIWNPLEMKSTNINVPAELKKDIAVGYEWENGINMPQNWEWYHTTPASSINSTAEDMAHWMLAHLNRGQYNNRRIMSQKMMDEMLKHQQGMHPQTYGLAYGFFEEYYNGLCFLYHGGNMAGFNSHMILIPEKNAGFFFVSQHEGSSIRDHLQWTIFEKYYKNTDSLNVPAINPDNITRAKIFAGQYKYNVYCHSCDRQANTMVFNVVANSDGTIQVNNHKWIEA